MTPPRLNELKCPGCQKVSWVIDSDFRGIHGVAFPFHEREYSCRGCGRKGPGWKLLRQSPPAFLLQPHQMYPMTRRDFDYWVAILAEHFPDNPRLRDLGHKFYPNEPGIGRRLLRWLTR
jgi:hypothetical protein